MDIKNIYTANNTMIIYQLIKSEVQFIEHLFYIPESKKNSS